MNEQDNRIRTPWFPRYSEVRQLLNMTGIESHLFASDFVPFTPLYFYIAELCIFIIPYTAQCGTAGEG